jgi:hypothetical protein
MQSPIAHMQQAMLRPDRMAGFGHLRNSLDLAGLRGFGSGLTEGITGAKAGVSAAGAATTIGTGVASAIGAGAAAGSVVPIIGTAIGVIVALVASGVFNHRMDPEVGNFNNAMALVRNQGPQAVLGIQDKYLVLAGLFDLEPGQIKGNIPIYQKYGRKGEFRFVNDLCNLIQSAANQGIINANDTVQSVYDKVVAPWINGFGFGPMQDSNAEMITNIILGLIGEYVSGQYKTRWYSVGGDFQFGGLPPFTLPVAAATAPGPSGTPTQGPTAAPPSVVPPAPAGPQVAPVQTGVSIPTGFVIAAQNANTGAPLYSGPDGRFYGWDGVSMTPFTGSLLVNGQLGAAQTGVLQPAQTSPLQTALPQPLFQPQPFQFAPAQPAFPTMQQTPMGPTVITVPQNAPAQPAVAAGFTGAGLPSWLTWGAVGAVALLMFATALPLRGGSYKRSAS